MPSRKMILRIILAFSLVAISIQHAQARGLRDLIRRLIEPVEKREQRANVASRIEMDALQGRTLSVLSDLSVQIARPQSGRILMSVGLEKQINKLFRLLDGREELIFIEGPVGSGKTQAISGGIERLKSDAAKGIIGPLSKARFIGVNLSNMANPTPFAFHDLFREALESLKSDESPLVLVFRELGPLFAKQEDVGPIMAYLGQIRAAANSRGVEVKVIIEGTNGEIQSVVKNNLRLKNAWESSSIKILERTPEEVKKILSEGTKVIAKNSKVADFSASFSEDVMDLARIWGEGYYRKFSQPYASLKLLEDATAIRKQAFLDAKSGREFALISEKRESLALATATLNRARELANLGRKNAKSLVPQLQKEVSEIQAEVDLLVKNYGSTKKCCEITKEDLAVAVSEAQTDTSISRLLRLSKSKKAWEPEEIERRFNELVAGQPQVAKAVAQAIKDILDPRTSNSAKMIIISGPPGTGKSHSKWATHQILDEMDLEPGSLDIGTEKTATSHGAKTQLVGSPAGYTGWGETETLADAVKSNKPTVVLIDELEKGEGKAVQDLLLTPLQAGTFTDVLSGLDRHSWRDNLSQQNVRISA